MTQASAGLPEKQEYDAVVLGSGPSELTCALLLARRGRSVLVVERGRALGGPAALREFAPGFRAALAPAEAGHVSRRLVTSLGLGEHGFSPEARHWPLVGVGEGSPPLVLSGDLAASQGSIAAVSKRDAEQWVSFATQMERLAAFMEALATRDAVVLTNGQDGLGARDLLSLAGHGLRLRSLGKADMIEMLRVLPMAVADVLEDRFESERLKAMLAVTALANLFQGPRSGGTGATLLHHHMGQARGAFGNRRFPTGERDHLVAALLAACKKAGVESVLGRKPKVAVESGRAVAVDLGGHSVKARAVISGADPKRAFLEDLDPWHLAPEFVRAVTHVKLRGVRAVLLLGLDDESALATLAPECRKGTMVSAASINEVERAYDHAKHGDFSKAPVLEVTVPSLHDASLAASGKHVMHVAAQFAPFSLRAREGGWTDETKGELKIAILRRLEAMFPGLGAGITASRLYTPPDLEAELGLTEGHLYGGEMTLDQLFFMRPVAGAAHHETPIAGYYLTGDATHPGGGVPCRAGQLAADRVP
ncbi:MAG: NAD(P)/FAD-dependent oxidoreductase [Myxococcales bacterium]|nr:NAD(P)/FAD-dependent oxidoreductase [Myxococcales bacterium]